MANIIGIIVGVAFSFVVLMTVILLVMQCKVRGWLGETSNERQCITGDKLALVIMGVIMVLLITILLIMDPGIVHHGDVAEADLTWYWCYQCQHLVPSDATHCRLCQHCVRNRLFEYHCSITGNCVTRKTLPLIIMLLLAAFAFFSLCILVQRLDCNEEDFICYIINLLVMLCLPGTIFLSTLTILMDKSKSHIITTTDFPSEAYSERFPPVWAHPTQPLSVTPLQDSTGTQRVWMLFSPVYAPAAPLIRRESEGADSAPMDYLAHPEPLDVGEGIEKRVVV